MNGDEFGPFQGIWLAASWIMASITAISLLGIKPKIWDVFNKEFQKKLNTISTMIGGIGFVVLWYLIVITKTLTNGWILALLAIAVLLLFIGIFLYEFFQAYLIRTKKAVLPGDKAENNQSKDERFIRGWCMRKDASENYKKAKKNKPSLTFEDFLDGCGNNVDVVFSALSIALGRFSFYLMHILLVCSGIWALCIASMLVYIVTQGQTVIS